jgi:ATP-dependent DNA helicase RecQ
MTVLRGLLDDVTLAKDDSCCNKCRVCLGRPRVPETFDPQLADQAVSYLKTSKKLFLCKTEAPNEYVFPRYRLVREIPPELQAEQGRVLSYWMDAGWGTKIHDCKRDGTFGDELVGALAEMIRKRWQPWKPMSNWGWVTCVPSTRHQRLVPDFARRLAKRLQLPFYPVVEKVYSNEPQKSRKNGYHRCRNLDGAFVVREDQAVDRGPVLLVDDIIRSTWTVTVIAALLRQAGSGKVFPVALARIGSED